MTNEEDIWTEKQRKGGTWEVPLKPSDKVQIGINGVVSKELHISDYMTLQIKTWERFQKK